MLITGWGCPHLDADALVAAPELRTVLHAAGSVRSLIGDALWKHGVTVSSAVTGNALPVAEYTLAMILLAGKDTFTHRERFRATHTYPTNEETASTGNVGRRIGVIGASRVGRRLLELLRPFDFTVLLHDPYVSPAEAAELGAQLLSLEDLLRHSDIVSLHAPDIPETYRMLDGDRLALIRDGGVLINTSRGALVDHDALTDELVLRPTARDPRCHGARAASGWIAAVPTAQRVPHAAHRRVARERVGAAGADCGGGDGEGGWGGCVGA